MNLTAIYLPNRMRQVLSTLQKSNPQPLETLHNFYTKPTVNQRLQTFLLPEKNLLCDIQEA